MDADMGLMTYSVKVPRKDRAPAMARLGADRDDNCALDMSNLPPTEARLGIFKSKQSYRLTPLDTETRFGRSIVMASALPTMESPITPPLGLESKCEIPKEMCLRFGLP